MAALSKQGGKNSFIAAHIQISHISEDVTFLMTTPPEQLVRWRSSTPSHNRKFGYSDLPQIAETLLDH